MDAIAKPVQNVLVKATAPCPDERFTSATQLFEAYEASVKNPSHNAMEGHLEVAQPGVTREVNEEARRLDAAMPGQTVVNRPTELWIQPARLRGFPGIVARIYAPWRRDHS